MILYSPSHLRKCILAYDTHSESLSHHPSDSVKNEIYKEYLENLARRGPDYLGIDLLRDAKYLSRSALNFSYFRN